MAEQYQKKTQQALQNPDAAKRCRVWYAVSYSGLWPQVGHK